MIAWSPFALGGASVGNFVRGLLPVLARLAHTGALTKLTRPDADRADVTSVMKGPLFNELLSARLAPRPGRRLPGRSLGIPLLVTALLSIGYLIWDPTAPDLLAQVARAGVAARAGSVGWWTGWFGGL